MNTSTSKEQSANPFSFQGFEIPQSNFFYMPREWLKIRAKYVKKCPSMIFVIEYILAHTWGWTYRDDDGNIVHEQKRLLSRDDFVNGRKKKDGSRYDNGTGLSESSVKNGLEMAEELGFIEVEIDASDRARIKKYYSLKMKTSMPEQKEAGNTNETESQGEKSYDEVKETVSTANIESREEEPVTNTSSGVIVTPPTVNPLGGNDYPSYIRVNNSSKNFSSSIIDSEKIENEIVDNPKEEEQPNLNASEKPPHITNYAALTPDEKLIEIANKSRYSAVKARGASEDWKDRITLLKSQVEEQKKHASEKPQQPENGAKSRGVDISSSTENIPSQIGNKTLVQNLKMEIEELEKLLNSLSFLGSDVSSRLGGSENKNKNTTHLANMYRDAAKKGMSFTTFMDLAYSVCKDVQSRTNVKNKGAYYFRALEQRLGIRENG